MTDNTVQEILLSNEVANALKIESSSTSEKLFTVDSIELNPKHVSHSLINITVHYGESYILKRKAKSLEFLTLSLLQEFESSIIVPPIIPHSVFHKGNLKENGVYSFVERGLNVISQNSVLFYSASFTDFLTLNSAGIDARLQHLHSSRELQMAGMVDSAAKKTKALGKDIKHLSVGLLHKIQGKSDDNKNYQIVNVNLERCKELRENVQVFKKAHDKLSNACVTMGQAESEMAKCISSFNNKRIAFEDISRFLEDDNKYHYDMMSSLELMNMRIFEFDAYCKQCISIVESHNIDESGNSVKEAMSFLEQNYIDMQNEIENILNFFIDSESVRSVRSYSTTSSSF